MKQYTEVNMKEELNYIKNMQRVVMNTLGLSL